MKRACIPHPRMNLCLDSVKIRRAGNSAFQHKPLRVVFRCRYVLNNNAVSFGHSMYVDAHDSKGLKIL